MKTQREKGIIDSQMEFDSVDWMTIPNGQTGYVQSRACSWWWLHHKLSRDDLQSRQKQSDGNGTGGQTLASLLSSLRTEDQTGGKQLKKWNSQNVGHQMRPKRATHTRRAFTTELIGADQCAPVLYLLNVGQCQSSNLAEVRITDKIPVKRLGYSLSKGLFQKNFRNKSFYIKGWLLS